MNRRDHAAYCADLEHDQMETVEDGMVQERPRDCMCFGARGLMLCVHPLKVCNATPADEVGREHQLLRLSQ